jgi:hypothetical protein
MNNNINLIVTHPGMAHRDEMISISLLLATVATGARIERRNPTTAEMDDPRVLVVDTGLQYDRSKGNLDHHQEISQDSAPGCAITKVLEYLGEDLEVARKAWRWFEATEVVDSKGPKALANFLAMPDDAVFIMQSPMEGALLKWFSGLSACRPDDPGYNLLEMIGNDLFKELRETEPRLQLLSQVTRYEQVNDLYVANTAAIDRNDRPAFATEAFFRGSKVEVILAQDDRGSGYTLLRRNDAPRVDFTKVKDDPEVIFAHGGGFIAKTVPGADWRRLVALARVD